MLQNVYRAVWQLPPAHLRRSKEFIDSLSSICDPNNPELSISKIDINFPSEDARKVGIIIRDNPEAFSSLTEDEHEYLMQQIAITVLVMIDDNKKKYQIPLSARPEEVVANRDYYVELIRSNVNGQERYIANISAGPPPRKTRFTQEVDDDDIDPADFWKD